LGGVRITMGDRRIDATISGRLDEFARELHRQKDFSI
jgi:F0F1-type ATP synthase delta subunit